MDPENRRSNVELTEPLEEVYVSPYLADRTKPRSPPRAKEPGPENRLLEPLLPKIDFNPVTMLARPEEDGGDDYMDPEDMMFFLTQAQPL